LGSITPDGFSAENADPDKSKSMVATKSRQDFEIFMKEVKGADPPTQAYPHS
jgi:hypothetical protein